MNKVLERIIDVQGFRKNKSIFFVNGNDWIFNKRLEIQEV